MARDIEDLSGAAREANRAFDQQVFIPRVVGAQALQAALGNVAALTGTEQTGAQSFGAPGISTERTR